MKDLGNFSQVGIGFATSIIVCFFVGRFIDNKFGTSPIFLIIFIVLGVLAGFKNLFKLINK